LQEIQPASGEVFSTVSFDTPVYLTYLSTRFLSKGGRIVRGSVQHISEIAESGVFSFLSHEEKKHIISKPDGVKPPAAIVVCAGLGARFLGGVEDKDVYPIRGQTVLVNAPWIKHGKTLSDLDANEWTYMIPRKSGMIILGGTLEPNDW
jgi:glycine/D-amino acid oxidase-like deaminating enzyme